MTKQTETKRIDSYSFMEFCQLTEQAIKEGYSFDFESNENFPQMMGSFITCGLVKGADAKANPAQLELGFEATEVITETTTEVITETTAEVLPELAPVVQEAVKEQESAPAKRGRKPKAETEAE